MKIKNEMEEGKGTGGGEALVRGHRHRRCRLSKPASFYSLRSSDAAVCSFWNGSKASFVLLRSVTSWSRQIASSLETEENFLAGNSWLVSYSITSHRGSSVAYGLMPTK